MDLDQHHRIAESAGNRTEDGSFVVASIVQYTAEPMRHYRLDFRIGIETYVQDVYADDMPAAMRLALETIETVAAWEGTPDEMSLSQTEEI
jgi:hypothetical protein